MMVKLAVVQDDLFLFTVKNLINYFWCNTF